LLTAWATLLKLPMPTLLLTALFYPLILFPPATMFKSLVKSIRQRRTSMPTTKVASTISQLPKVPHVLDTLTLSTLSNPRAMIIVSDAATLWLTVTVVSPKMDVPVSSLVTTLVLA